jgi:hypothetical protein
MKPIHFTFGNENGLSLNPFVGAHSDRFCTEHIDIAEKLITLMRLDRFKVLVLPATIFGKPLFILLSEVGINIIYENRLEVDFADHIHEIRKACEKSGNKLNIVTHDFPQPSDLILEINDNI